ncbi:hypothetical protein CDIK_3832, partial [Cucumispora dikerogammari]
TDDKSSVGNLPINRKDSSSPTLLLPASAANNKDGSVAATDNKLSVESHNKINTLTLNIYTKAFKTPIPAHILNTLTSTFRLNLTLNYKQYFTNIRPKTLIINKKKIAFQVEKGSFGIYLNNNNSNNNSKENNNNNNTQFTINITSSLGIELLTDYDLILSYCYFIFYLPKASIITLEIKPKPFINISNNNNNVIYYKIVEISLIKELVVFDCKKLINKHFLYEKKFIFNNNNSNNNNNNNNISNSNNSNNNNISNSNNSNNNNNNVFFWESCCDTKVVIKRDPLFNNNSNNIDFINNKNNKNNNIEISRENKGSIFINKGKVNIKFSNLKTNNNNNNSDDVKFGRFKIIGVPYNDI